MPLTTGTRLGPYQIQSAIGAGGMGEVYKARDTRLQRDVAIKVLPEAFADDADRRERFQREAQAVAALSHPNILAIFDFGIEGHTAYAVTELLTGETLRERLGAAGGSASGLPARKAIDIAVQIMRGLAAAHERGLVHRDLKPENIFLCHDGQVKILDFGLARTQATATGATETVAALTDPGTVLGTVGYMAPEQVRGQATDARTDLFAFGTVLYEMLSGRRAFKGDTAADTMTAILREDPPELTGSRPDLSPAIDRIVRHCLEKNPSERFQAARDVAFALEALSGSVAMTSATLGISAPSRRWVRWVAAAAIVLAAVAAGMVLQMLRAPAAPAVQFDVKTFDRQTITNARFLPDGRTIAFSAARVGTTPELFVLRPDSVAPQPIAGPGTHLLSVSSKSELAVLTGSTYVGHRLYKGTLARMMVGGAPRPWMDGVREADWSPDGTALAIIRDAGQGVDRLEYPIGTPLYEAHGYLSDVRVSHDGRRVGFVEHRFRFDDRGAIKVIDSAKRLTASTDDFWGVEGLAWSADDESVLFSASDWNASGGSGIGYHPYALQSTGGRRAAPAVATMASAFVHDVNPSGQWLLAREDHATVVVVRKPGETIDRDLSWLDLPVPAALSPDGDVFVFTDENTAAGHSYSVMLRRTDGSPPVRLGDGSAEPRGLSPDGKWVLALLLNTNRFVFYPTGAGEPRPLDVQADQFRFIEWFPDSAHVVLCGSTSAEPMRCYRQAMTGGPMTPLSPGPAIGATVAPDGSYVVAETEEKAWRYPAGGGSPRLMENRPGTEGAAFAGWSTDSQPFMVKTSSDQSKEILLMPFGKPPITLGTFTPADRTGLTRVIVAQVVGDARRFGYAAAHTHQLSTLLVASGITLR